MGSRQRKKQQSKLNKTQDNHKFAVDERVLCYEPDMKKARVLYDSKVLEVVERKNHGKTKVEYKIHFFGWNSSWDRYVDEECVLKDTDENRDLQKELKERADELLQTHLKKRKRKKTLSELLKEATKDKGGKSSNPSHSKTKTDEESSRSHSSSDSSDQDTSDDEDENEDIAQIILTDHVRDILDRDCYNMTVQKMLVRIPVDLSVVCIFEAYVKDLGFRELRNVLEQREAYLKSNSTQFLPPALSASLAQASSSAGAKFPGGKGQAKPIEPWLEEINRIYRKVRQAQEIIYGLKTIFDYQLYVMLLYNTENEQYEASKSMRPMIPLVSSELIIPDLPLHVQKTQETIRSEQLELSTAFKKPEKTEGRRKVADPAGTTKPISEMTPGAPTRSQSKASQPQNTEKLMNDTAIWQKKVEKFIKDLDSWQMLPVESFEQEEPDPCMMYGMIHLLRLFVRLPDILNRMLLSRRKIRIIAHHVNQMIDHIEACYVYSTRDMYITVSQYEEDLMNVETAKPDDEPPEIEVVDVEAASSLSTKPLLVDLTAAPQLGRVVDISTLSSTDEEHHLTVSNIDPDTSINASNTETGDQTEPNPAVKGPSEPLTINVAFENPEDVVKLEPASPPLQSTPVQQPKKKSEPTKKATPRKPVSPVLKHRQMRESAAHAAVKNAHIFASQQNFSSRSSFSSASIKREPKEKEAAPIKRKSSPEAASSSPSKRITRTCSKSTSIDSTSDKATTPSLKTEDSKAVSQKQQAKSRPSSSPDRSKIKTEPNDLRKRSSTRASSSSSEGSKTLPKKIPSPRTSTSSPHRELGSLSRTPQKSTPPFSTSLRLRSKSGERQLRSKGSLVNAYSLPMQTSPRSSKSYEKSPKRRESVGSSSRDSCPQQSSSSPKHSDSPIRSLRSRR